MRNRSKKTYIVLAFIAVCLVGTGFFVIKFIEERIEEQRVLEEQKASVVEDIKSKSQEYSDAKQEDSSTTETENAEEQAVSENTVIANVHEHLNDLTGWGRYNSFDFNDTNDIRKIERIKEQVENLITVSDDDAQINDFTNALLVIEKAMENEDVQGFLYAHRIFHDLDVHVNHYDSEEVFGMSEWKNGQQHREIIRYLR